jgi:hypothetical protein
MHSVPFEKVRLLFPLRVPGGEISHVNVRPIGDPELAYMKADESGDRTLETVARAAGLAPQLGRNLADADLMRIAHAADRMRVKVVADRDAAA